jgi:hypothetical protein
MMESIHYNPIRIDNTDMKSLAEDMNEDSAE